MSARSNRQSRTGNVLAATSAAAAAFSTAKPATETPVTAEPNALDALPDATLATTVTAEAPVTPEPVADPFADLPLVTVAGVEMRDLSGATKVSDPGKYLAIHTASVADKLPTAKGWKHANKMLRVGINRTERKPTSVWGMIISICAAYGKSGVPAPVLVTALRQKQIGNKRSHFCAELPPLGWAEGWINTAITKNLIADAGMIPTAALTDESVAKAVDAASAAEAKAA